MAALLIVAVLSAVAAALIAYVIGRWGRTSTTVTSSTSAPVTKETACRTSDEETGHTGESDKLCSII